MTQDQRNSSSRRSPVSATRGMVAASQSLAARAGLEILMQGGNAADAAVATAAALAVTEPCSTGLGGDLFALYYDAASKKVSALNGSGRAPAALSLERVRGEGFTGQLPYFHPYTVTVPGACAGWCDLLERFGSLDRGKVLARAIRLAQEGFPVGPITAYHWSGGVQQLKDQSPGGRELLVDGRAPRSGELFRNPALAATLQEVAEGGKESFYEGVIAKRIVATLQALGGAMTLDDLASHTSSWGEPISTVYKGMRVHQCPPNGQGLTALLALNILSRFDFASLGEPLSVRRLHVLIEALRLAFADTRWYVTDPELFKIPLEELLSDIYAEERSKLIDPKRAVLDQRHGSPAAGSDTVYFSVVDGRGNACSFVNSNYMGFGTGIVPEGLGFSLQNRGHNFSLDPKHPNALAPRKRPYHTIICAIATREEDASLYASFGVMGGFMQPQGHVQVLLGLLEDGLDPQAALDRPRICLEGGEAAGRVALEEGISEAVTGELRQLGHEVRKVSGHERSLFGRGQIILRDRESGVLCAGSDPRADGCASGY